MYLNDTLIPEGNIREEFQDGKSKKSNPFRHALCDRPDPAVLHRPDPGSWKNERLEAYYDMKVFLTIDPIEQIQRIEKRNGSEKAVEFQKKWIPLEELYFEKCRTRSRCDVCFTMCDEM